MKTIIIPFLILLPSFLWAQTVDSTAIRQVDSLIQVSHNLTAKGDFDQALEVNAAAEKIALEKLGRESAVYGTCCFRLGIILRSKGLYREATNWYYEALSIYEKVLGKEHPNYINNLNEIGLLYFEMGNYEKAEQVFLDAITAWEKTSEKENTKYAGCLNNLANVYKELGKYESAELLYIKTLAIDEKLQGKETASYAMGLNNLANLYRNMGNFEKAESLLVEAKTIRGKVLGNDHTDFAYSLLNLANLYLKMGLYEKAESLYIEAKIILAKVLGSEHPNYSVALNNLAGLYYAMGNYEKAESLFIEAKEIRSKMLGKEHPQYASSLNNLAELYVNKGDFEKAKQFHFEAKEIWAKVFGKEHRLYAESIINLAELNRLTGDHLTAYSLFNDGISILGKTLGKEHIDYVQSLNKLANLLKYKGDYENAEQFYIEAKSVLKNVTGEIHPEYEKCLNGLAVLYEIQHRFSESEPLLAELYNLEQGRLLKSTFFLSERELAKYAAIFQRDGENIGAYLLARHSTSVTTLPKLAFDNALFHKGFLLNAASRLNSLTPASPELMEIKNRFKSYRRRLANEYTKPIAERKDIVELEEKANTAEKEFARSIAGYANAVRQVKWREVRSALKEGDAAIEFINFKVNFPKQTDSTMYVALLLLPGLDQPRFIPLFEEKQLDSLLQSHGGRKADYVNGLYSIAERGAKPLGSPQKSLYELIWQPLEKELEGIKAIYFSPSGLLHRINLGAVPISDEETLADKYRMVELGSTRQLVIPTKVETVELDAVLFGGIEYEMDSTAIAAANVNISNETVASRGELSFSYADSTNRGGTWNYLKWTDKEVTALEPILKTAGIQANVRKGFAATEELFKAIGKGSLSPRILHIATHGFFFPDPKTADAGRQTLDGESVFKISDHPMIRSGLILAGGNYAWQTGKPLKPGMEDGILTAYEISQMNLSSTELVVLSACETGLGDIQGNEGVYGLQRAFKIAGAKYLVMSLWQVPDQETSVFMTKFYSHFIEGKMTIPDAFHTTQQEMRERFINPYQWAGFVLVE